MGLVIDVAAYAGPAADAANVRARLKWMDAQGIDLQNVVYLPETGADTRECNDWLAAYCAEGNGRLLPVTAPGSLSPAEATAELERMRQRGSRMALLPQTAADAPSAWEEFWQASIANGMALLLHGNSWSAAVRALAEAGLFGRHPQLALIVATQEAGALLADLMPQPGATALAANVRIALLTGGGNGSPVDLLKALPEDMPVFASGWPQGSVPDISWEQAFPGTALLRRQQFMGGSVGDMYARMGQPLRKPRVLMGCGGRGGA